jgi:hypothetical protein
VFPTGQRYGGTNLGGWVDLLHRAVPNWSIGAEGGWFPLAGDQIMVLGFAPGPRIPMGSSRGLFSASGVFRGRSPGPVRLHMLGTFGYYDLVTRTHFVQGDDHVEHEWSPGFSLGIGVSGSGLVRPGFQLRWHETVGPEHDNMDVVSFEAGLHFN